MAKFAKWLSAQIAERRFGLSDFRLREGSRNVHEAALERIRMVFDANARVYASFSGGKDSLCVAGLLEELIQANEMDPGKLEVLFVDEEAIYPCVEKIVLQWRKKFLAMGAKFHWLCLPVKHFNCFNQLENDESFICFDPRKQDVWVRQPPKFAIRSHPVFRPGDNYQAFLDRVDDGMNIIGTRASESYQRVKNIAKMAQRNKGGSVASHNRVFPIHDWRDDDVWLYLKERNIQWPDAYLHMYKLGFNRRQLRLSQFFSVDTAKALVRMFEFYPDLYQKVLRREPNAYLAMYYWDSEMFRRSSSKRKQLEGNQPIDNMREKSLKQLEEKVKFRDPSLYRHTKRFIMMYDHLISPRTWKRMHDMLVAGDPKRRTFRALYADLNKEYKNAEYSGTGE
jgi:predicted phosphoadenosine phosphosulfate sulfurtransferase